MNIRSAAAHDFAGKPKFILRPATNADGPGVLALVTRVLREYGLEPDTAGLDADLGDIGKHYLAGGSFDVLVEESGAIVGSVGLHPVDATTCELRKMYLAPGVRGGGQGARLLDHALARARELGFARVTLETAAVLKTAIALYKRRGFQSLPAAPLASRCDQAYYLNL